MGRSDEGEGRYDYFPGEAKNSESDFQAHGSIAGRYTVFHFKEILNSLFQFLNTTAIVCLPSSGQHVIDSPQKSFPIPDVRSAHMEFFREGWLASEDD